MGCTSDKDFEDEVKKQIYPYIISLSLKDLQKQKYITWMKEDLKKKVAAFKSYHYVFKDEDVSKVVEEYKQHISGNYI